MPNIGNVSILNINGNELTIKDSALTEIVNEIVEAIGQNNEDISQHINDLNDKAFDNLIKITSNNENEISNIQDGLYKLQYITTSGEEPNVTETLNNTAILIQKGTNQYLIKDGQISSRTKTNNAWGTWTSVIPDDNHLLHLNTGNFITEQNIGFSNFQIFNSEIYGGCSIKNHSGVPINVESTLYFDNDGFPAEIILDDDNQEGFTQIKRKNGNSFETLQQALNERNNVQSDWNEGSTASAAYIKNKPTALTNNEIDDIWDENLLGIKTFTIYLDNNIIHEYQFENNMTWGEWINSNYNIDNLIRSSINDSYVEAYDQRYWYIVCDNQYNYMNINDTIDNSIIYRTNVDEPG